MDASEFISRNGNLYTIEVDDFGEEVRVFSQGKKVGAITLRLIEGDYQKVPDSYHITNLALSACKGEGVGRRCLELHKEFFSAPITAGPEDGSRPDDGSYLIDDGPGFIAAMRKAGLVCPAADESSYWDRFDEE